MALDTRPVPVTILTGYLGSGKTTLLNRILTEKHGHRIAVIENEFGEIGIDGDLVINADEEIFEMNNGCICCTVRGDLIRILGRLLARKERFDHILIETTGLADPAPVVQTFFVDEEIKAKTYLNAVVTLVDAKHLDLHWEDAHEVQEQIAFADRLILNKIDLVSSVQVSKIREKIRALNATAEIYETVRSQMDVGRLLDVAAFSLERALEIEPQLLEEEHHEHDESIGSVGIELAGELDEQRLNSWFARLLKEKGQDIFRMKGVLAIQNQDAKMVFQGVHMLVDAAPLGSWKAGEPRHNRVVFIGRDLNRKDLQEGLSACLA